MKVETLMERFEKQAEEFYQDTGYLAPGKDRPAASPYSEEQEVLIKKLWQIWLKGYARGLEASERIG